MNRRLFKSIVAAGAVAMICACGDDAASNNATNPGTGNDPGAGVVDNPNSSSAVIDPGNPGSSGSVNPGSSANLNDPTSSAAVVPGSSASVVPGSSADAVPESSSSSVNTEPELDEKGFPTIDSYGPPPAEYTKDISATAKRGWNTRYWDACKPHCSWLRENSNDVTRADTSSNEAYLATYGTARNCNIHDVEVPTFTLGNVSKSWFGYEGTNSACTKVKEKWRRLP